MSDEPKMLRIEVEADLYALDSEPVAIIVPWAQAILDQVPVEYRQSVLMAYDTGDGYSAGGLRISYMRPETQAERHKREHDEREHAAKEIARKHDAERALYERLKAKFENT